MGLDQPPPPPPAAPPAAGAEPPPPPDDKGKKSVVPADVIEPGAKVEIPIPDAVTEIRAMTLPKNAKPEQVANFNTLKTKAETSILAQATKIADLERQIKGATSETQLTELREQLRVAEEKASGIEEKFTKTAFEHSPRFKALFTDKESAALDGAKSYLEGVPDIKPEIIDIAAQTTPAKRGAILKEAGIDPDLIPQILPHLANYDAVQREKKAALDNWKTQAGEWQAEDQKRIEGIRAQKLELGNRVWDTVVKNIDLLPLRETKENPEWNTRRETIFNEAKEIFNGKGAKPEVLAETILKGRAYDAQEEVLKAVIEENKVLRAANAGMKSATPGGHITGGEPPAPPANATREETAKSTFNAEKQKVGAT